jgi:hypothetical protein
MKEVAWIEPYKNSTIIQFKIGTETEVTFDLLDIWLNHRNKQLAYFHTHPASKKAMFSSKDLIAIESIKHISTDFIYGVITPDNEIWYIHPQGTTVYDKIISKNAKTMLEISQCL